MIKIYDLVALKTNTKAKLFPTSQAILLRQGQIGTIVEILKEGEVFEVEFSNGEGQAYAMLPISQENLMVLYDEPILLAS